MSRSGSGRGCGSRSVCYRFESKAGFDVYAAKDLLRVSPAVLTRGTGGDCIVWFEGTPGPELRRAKRALLALVGELVPTDREPAGNVRLPRGLRRAYLALRRAGVLRAMPHSIRRTAGICYAPRSISETPRGWSTALQSPPPEGAAYGEALAELARRGLAIPVFGMRTSEPPIEYRDPAFYGSFDCPIWGRCEGCSGCRRR